MIKTEPKKLTAIEKARRVCASAGAALSWADRCSEAEQRELAALYDAGKATYDDFQAWRRKRASEKAADAAKAEAKPEEITSKSE